MSMDSYISDNEKRLMLWQAHHDNLTKLPNANLLHERLARAAQQAGRSELVHAQLVGVHAFADDARLRLPLGRPAALFEPPA